MKLFRKKVSDVAPVIQHEHEHTWKDFPWYMETAYSEANHSASVVIKEPYVCITCGERIDKTLEKIYWSSISAAEREKEYREIRKAYRNYLKPKAVVEDMIQDVLMVKDPAALEIIEKMQGLPHQGCGSSGRGKKEDDFRIIVENKNGNN